MLLSTVVSLNRSKTSGGNQSAIRVNKILYALHCRLHIHAHACTQVHVYALIIFCCFEFSTWRQSFKMQEGFPSFTADCRAKFIALLS